MVLGSFTLKRKSRGTDAAQRSWVARLCGRWNDELISTAFSWLA